MGTKYKEDVYTVCPMYCKDAPCEIRCLPMAEEATHTTMSFPNAATKRSYKEDFCNGCFWNCSLYRGLAEIDTEDQQRDRQIEATERAKYLMKLKRLL